MRARLKKDLVIPAGTVFETAPTVTRRHAPCGQALLSLADDHTYHVDVFRDGMEARPDLFEVEETDD